MVKKQDLDGLVLRHLHSTTMEREIMMMINKNNDIYNDGNDDNHWWTMKNNNNDTKDTRHRHCRPIITLTMIL